MFDRHSPPAVAGFSLGAKFVGLTAGLILLLSLTAFISLRQSAHTVLQLRAVVDFAIPAYGALARSHIRSLEQALALRRTLILANDAAASDDAIAARIQAFDTARTAFDSEFAEAQRLIGQQRDNASSETVAAAFQKLSEALSGMAPLIERYEREAAACLAAARARSLDEAYRRLVTIDVLRDEMGQRLEATRAGMFSVLQTISTEVQDAEGKAQLATIAVFVLASILGLSVAAIGAVRLIRAIRSLVRGAEAVEGGNLETQIDIRSGDEIGRLAASFNRMTEGLRMRDLIRETFGRYVDRRIAEQLIDSRSLLAERGDRREVAVMFCDLAGFTALSERVEAERLVEFLNAYFSVVAREIAATDGIIDKYIGDAVMAYWCPPFVPADEVATRSADAALRCMGRLPEIAAASREVFGSGVHQPDIRIGIASGQSITGSIGAKERRNYTVIGETVNLASRIEVANRLYNTRCLICETTAEAVRPGIELREIDKVRLPGIDVAQSIYEIVGRAGQLSPAQGELQIRYAQALAAYRRGDWEAARDGFQQCLAVAPLDGPAEVMLKRLGALAAMSPEQAGWNGVWRLSKEDVL